MDEAAAEHTQEEDSTYHLHVESYGKNPDAEIYLPGFTVTSGPGSYINCREGLLFQSITDEEGEELETLDVVYLRSRQKGMGTLLMRRAIEEGVRRGFKRARMDIRNPRVVSVIEKLKTEGLIKRVIYFQDHNRARDLSTPELLDTVPVINAEAAKEYMGSFDVDEEDYQDEGTVDCLVEF